MLKSAQGDIQTKNMSLLSLVEQTIKSYKDEQAKINDSIQLYREILQTL